jgi:hypothetical protein
MLSAKNKVVITVFGVLAIVILLMYVLDRSSNQRVERFRAAADNDDEEEDAEENAEEDIDDEFEEVPKEDKKASKQQTEKLPIANKKTMKETTVPEGHDEHISSEQPIASGKTPNDVVSHVSQWMSNLNIPSSLKTETFKEMFNEENIDKLKNMVNLQQAKDWATDIMSSLNGKKEDFASTIAQRRTINQLKDKLKQMEEDLNNLMDDLEEPSPKKKPEVKVASNDYVSFGLAPAPTASPVLRDLTKVSMGSLPTVRETTNTLDSIRTTDNATSSRLLDKEPLFAKNSDTIASALGSSVEKRRETFKSNDVIEGFENVRHSFAMY